MTLLCNKSNKN